MSERGNYDPQESLEAINQQFLAEFNAALPNPDTMQPQVAPSTDQITLLQQILQALQQTSQVGIVSSFPKDGSQYAAPAGRIVVDVQNGRVNVQGQTTGNYNLSRSLQSIGQSEFRSFFLYADQPAIITIDDLTSIPFNGGVTVERAVIRKRMMIDSYMPQCVHLVLSTGLTDPWSPSRICEFRRYATFSTTNNAFTEVPLVPVSFSYSKGSVVGQPAQQNLLSSSLINTGEGRPYTGHLQKLSFIVDNTHASNNITFKLLGVNNETATYKELNITGTTGIEVAAGEAAELEIDSVWSRLQFQVQSSVSGSSGSGSAVLQGIF